MEKELDKGLLEAKEEFTEEEVAMGMNETATGEKHVTIDGLGNVVLKYPSRKDELEADIERSRALTRFLVDEGLKTEDEMRKIAESRGLWTKEHEKQLSDTQKELAKVQLDIRDAKTKDKQNKLRKKLMELRTELVALFNKKNTLFSHTVESKAGNIWWSYLTYRCTYKEDCETRFWDSWDDFMDDLASDPSSTLLAEFISFYNGLPENFFDSWVGEVIEPRESGETDGK